ncbi:MAG: glycosyltransferase [Verrucomicrobia bacterium]|nr:glycosyltransferase [Verrucomicrobiota bacterium]
MHSFALPSIDEIQGPRPRFSVIIPTKNCALTIAWTLSTLNVQTYPHIEVILVDAGSKDRTLEVAKSTCDLPLRIYTIADHNIMEMYNRGISLAHGDYVSLLKAGDGYLWQEAFALVAVSIVKEKRPDLVYCGCLRRNPYQEPEVVLGTLDIGDLKRGKQPTSIESCWFRVDSIRQLNKFDTAYQTRGGFELFCRIAKHSALRTVSLRRVLVDHERPEQRPGQLVQRALETEGIIRKYYGWRTAMMWGLRQNHWAFLKWLWRSIRPHLWS